MDELLTRLSWTVRSGERNTASIDRSMHDGRRLAARARRPEWPSHPGLDLDFTNARAWIRGSSKAEARWGLLSEWGAVELARRVGSLKDVPEDDPPVAFGGWGSEESPQASKCIAIAETLQRAGIGREPDVRPGSVVAWAGVRIFSETGRIEEVARRPRYAQPGPGGLVHRLGLGGRSGRRGVAVYRAAPGVGTLEKVEAVLRNPAIYEQANMIPQAPKEKGRRGRDYPDFMYLVFEALISVYASARQVEAELANKVV